MIATFLLPPSAAHRPNAPQVLVTGQSLQFAVAMRPNPRPTGRRDGGTGLAPCNGLVARALVVAAIGRYLADGLLDLFQQAGQYLPVTGAVGRRRCRLDVARTLVHRQMDLAPDPALGGSVLTRLPLAVAEDLPARAIYDQMQRPRWGRR